MAIDPGDDCTFWYTQEYYKTTGAFNWSTRIAAFKFDSCKTQGEQNFRAPPAGALIKRHRMRSPGWTVLMKS